MITVLALVALGIGTIILDECHHLLDYWAFILRELIKALPGVRVVGLTATLPDSESRQAYENYLSLLGEVDFEVPTPAVVKEGNLAPYRDLVYFCEPSPREHAYLRNIQEHFEAAIRQVTASPAFGDWLRGLLLERRPAGLASNEPPEPFSAVFNREPLLCIAGIKALLAQGVALPADIPLVEEMSEPLTVDDWLTLLERFGLEVGAGAAFDEDSTRALLEGAYAVLCTGAAGITLVPESVWVEHPTLAVLADVNAVPPLGVEGIKPGWDGKEKHGKVLFGALGIGGLKMKIHRASVARLFDQNDLVLDAEEVYGIARELIK